MQFVPEQRPLTGAESLQAAESKLQPIPLKKLKTRSFEKVADFEASENIEAP